MSDNPARELRRIFESWGTRNNNANLTRALNSQKGIEETALVLRLLDSINKCLNVLEAQGQQVQVFRDATNDWLRDIFHFPHSWMNERQATSRHDMLLALEALLDVSVPSLSPIDESRLVQGVSELLDEVLETIKDDETLDPFLRDHMFASVEHARSCLDHFDLLGVFDIAMAIKDLEILVAAAQSMTTSDPSRWERVRTRAAGFTQNPTTAAVIGALSGSGATALLTQS